MPEIIESPAWEINLFNPAHINKMYTINTKKRVNSRKYTPIKEFETEEQVIEYLKENNIHYANTPYIFTHIMLSDGSVIKQEHCGMICSPTKLKDILTGKETI